MTHRTEAFPFKAFLTACALALAALLTGCPKAPKVVSKRLPGTAKETRLAVKVHVAAAANGGNPVALDLVLVSDKDLLKELQKMTASDWFAKRSQILLDHPKAEELSVRQWEWVPGQVVAPDSLRIAPEMKTALIFANYFNPGEHRAVIDPHAKGVLIQLGEDKLEVVTSKN
jgi:hypothetical protein